MPKEPYPAMDLSGPIVRFENVSMQYGAGPEILTDVSFDIEPGSFHFLTGSSGAGKSSLLKIVYLAQAPSRGAVSVLGHDVASTKREALPDLRRRIGVVFQDFRLIDSLTALENVALALEVAGARRKEVREHVAELLEWVGLADRADARPASLSGGEQQRVAVARAVINNPQLLLADEPTGSVDRAIGTRILYLFEELNRMGTTVLIATHNDELASRFDYPRLHLENGELTLQPTS
ncbi:MAG: cell division ATP-binding protein FtsE [Alphaproteobacteria bacterium]|nr:cell division ATP-binding protein FtsE [Alphaproteobacteria bacterium]